MNKETIQLLLVMGTALIIVLPITIALLNAKERRDKVENNIGASLAKRSTRNIRVKIYRILNRFVVTRGYTDRIRRYYEMLYPGDEADLLKKTVNTTILTWMFCAAAIIVIFLWNMNFCNTLVLIMVVYVINTEIIGFMIMRTEIRLLEELAIFISNVRHNFYVRRMVDDAIYLSMQEIKGYEMRAHAERLYEILTSSNVEEEVLNYNSTIHNKFLKMFLSICISVMEHQDKTTNGQDLFAVNLDNLKRMIENEYLKLRQIQYKFAGITFICVAAGVPIDGIRAYSISMEPSLAGFYNGRMGYIYVAITIITVLVFYVMINQLKGMRRQLPKNYLYLRRLEKMKFIKTILDNYEEKQKNYQKMLKLKDYLKRIGESISPRQFILRRLLISVVVCLSSIVFFIYLHDVNRTNISEHVSSLPVSITAVNTAQEKAIKDVIVQCIRRYKDDEIITSDQIVAQLTKAGTFYNTKMNQSIANEVMVRISHYKREHFQWYELLFSIMISIISYYVPYWMILYKRKVLQLSMEDEVNQLNSIIFMLMYSAHITVKDLLESMEMFAVVFRQTIQECINDYNSGDIEALEQMKEKESFGPFIRMVDNLIRCDSIAIYKAFDEIASDRENYHERRKLENEINVQKRADRAQVMAWVPAVLVMVYLIIPMIAEAYSALKMFMSMTQNL